MKFTSILLLVEAVVILLLSVGSPVSAFAGDQYRPTLLKYQDPQSGESYVVALIDFDTPWTTGEDHPTYQRLAEHILMHAKKWLIDGYKEDYKKDFPNLSPKFFDSLGSPLDGRSRMVVVFQDESLTKILGTLRFAFSTQDQPLLPMQGPGHETQVPDSKHFMGKYPVLSGDGSRISWELASYGGPVGVEFKNFRRATDAPKVVVPLMFYAAEKWGLSNSVAPVAGQDGEAGAARPLWYQLECLDPLVTYYVGQDWKENGVETSEFGPTLHYYLIDRLGFLQILVGKDGKKGMLDRPGAEFIRKAQEEVLLYDDPYLRQEACNFLLDNLKLNLGL